MTRLAISLFDLSGRRLAHQRASIDTRPMGDRIWHYMIGDDGAPRRLTQKVATDMKERSGLMPEYASQRRKIIVVKLEGRGRQPPLLQNAVGRYWIFDAAGSIGEGLWQEHCDLVDLLPGALGSPLEGVVDARRKFKLRSAGSKHYWTPTDDEMELIIRDIWSMSLNEWRSADLEALPSEFY